MSSSEHHSATTSIVLRTAAVSMVYPGPPQVTALCGVDLSVCSGEKLVVLGPSGAGKSTLLNLIGLLDRPTDGHVELLGRDTGRLNAGEVNRTRARHIGFVFQENHVLGQRTVAENLEMALAVQRIPRRKRAALVDMTLERVGLIGRRDSLARLLSGGEKQRLSVIRAGLGRPELLLADEPTGNLDDGNSKRILGLFDEQARAGAAVVVITHDTRLTRWADRTLHLDAGSVVGGRRR